MAANRLLAGEAADPATNLKAIVSLVSESLHISGARERLVAQVDQGASLSRPKLVGFVAGGDPQQSKFAIYLNRRLLFDDAHHLTPSIARALVHLELVRALIPSHRVLLLM